MFRRGGGSEEEQAWWSGSVRCVGCGQGGDAVLVAGEHPAGGDLQPQNIPCSASGCRAGQCRIRGAGDSLNENVCGVLDAVVALCRGAAAGKQTSATRKIRGAIQRGERDLRQLL